MPIHMIWLFRTSVTENTMLIALLIALKVYNKTHKCIGIAVTLILQNKTVPCNATEHATAKNFLLLPRPHSVWRHQPIPRLPTARRCRASFLYFNGGAIPLGGGAEKEKNFAHAQYTPWEAAGDQPQRPSFPCRRRLLCA